LTAPRITLDAPPFAFGKEIDMSKEAFNAFKAKVAADATLRQEMSRTLSQGGAKTTASVDEVVAFAKSRGFDFNPEDVKQNVELSDEELDAVAGGASVDYFLKLDGITGESLDSSYKEQIEIQSFSWGVR
jgi:predicted ribosomally synthesized peptide with nif11-like leader